MGLSVRFVVRYLLMAILPVLTLSGADSDNSRLFKEVKINGGEANCSTEGKNYKSVTLSSELTSARIPCSTICNMDDACVLFDTQGNICNMYTLTLSAVTPCASGEAGTRAYTKVLGVDIALHTSVQYSSTVDDHVVSFSELTSSRTTYPDYHYCPCTLEQANSWIRVDLGEAEDFSR
ncbi:uncharacterized protein LOC135213434 [Macrobrachium nipponense]|uniref:uncharacterized protein LOC135213434 n=1 Tax=Macrobrachium nipponense TaxID=159736 RepID=UPI0030C7BA49